MRFKSFKTVVVAVWCVRACEAMLPGPWGDDDQVERPITDARGAAHPSSDRSERYHLDDFDETLDKKLYDGVVRVADNEAVVKHTSIEQLFPSLGLVDSTRDDSQKTETLPFKPLSHAAARKSLRSRRNVFKDAAMSAMGDTSGRTSRRGLTTTDPHVQCDALRDVAMPPFQDAKRGFVDFVRRDSSDAGQQSPSGVRKPRAVRGGGWCSLPVGESTRVGEDLKRRSSTERASSFNPRIGGLAHLKTMGGGFGGAFSRPGLHARSAAKTEKNQTGPQFLVAPRQARESKSSDSVRIAWGK